MKSRIIWLVVVVAALGGFYYTSMRPLLAPAQPPLNKRLTQEFRPPEVAPPPLPEPKMEIPSIPLPLPNAVARPTQAPRDPRTALKMEVPIQDGSTIDFSIGAPVVRSQGDDKAALEKSLKEMADATREISFGPGEKKSGP